MPRGLDQNYASSTLVIKIAMAGVARVTAWCSLFKTAARAGWPSGRSFCAAAGKSIEDALYGDAEDVQFLSSAIHCAQLAGVLLIMAGAPPLHAASSCMPPYHACRSMRTSPHASLSNPSLDRSTR